MKRYFIVFFIIILLLAGCATHKVAYIPTESEQISLEPLQVEIDYEAYLLRIDLIRQKTTETYETTDLQGNTVTETDTVDVPYHYLGVDLGNGLFLDAHNNLSVNILKFLGIDRKKDDFKIVKNGITYEKTGNIFKEKYGNSTNKEITLKDTGATLDVGESIKANKHEIIVFNNEIIFEPGGVIKALWRIKINKTSDGAVISNVTQERKITLNANGNIHLSEGLVIKPSGKSLFFDLSGGFGADKIYLKHRTYFLKRSKNTLVYYDENLNGVTIDISENGVTVKKGPQIEVYEISYQN